MPYLKELPNLLTNVPFWRTVANLIYSKNTKLNLLDDNFGLPVLYVNAMKAHGDNDFVEQQCTKWLMISEFTSEDLAWDVVVTHFKHIENPSAMIQLRKSLELDFNDFIVLQTKNNPIVELEHDNAFTNFYSHT